MMFLMRILEGLLAGGVIVAAVSVWRLCWPSSSRSWRAVAWVVAAVAVFGVIGFSWAAALKVSLRTALGGDALVNAASLVLQAAIVSGIIVLAGGWILSFIRLGIPRFRAGSTSNLKYEAVSLTVCVALLVTSLELPLEARRQLTPEQRVALLDGSLRALADGDREMPRDTWDPDYVVQMVGRNPQQLFSWVRNNTYWIPYHGVLRGPVGVLMDRQGNSLDRAILLATLLEKAGYTARLAHGELTHEQAVQLLPGLVADRQIAFAPQQPVFRPDPGIPQVASRYQLDGSAVNETLQSQEQMLAHFSSELQARVADQSDRLLKAIDRPKAAEVWGRTFDAALNALTDHWWVQQQYGSNWVDLDVLVDGQKPGSALVPATQAVALKDLPAETHHEITVRVIAEQWANGRLSEYRALEQPLRPDELTGRPVILQFWPTEWIADEKPGRPIHDWKTEVLAQKEWDAVLAVGGNILSTTTIPDSGDDPYAPKGGAFGGLASAFSESMNVSPENKTLSAVWLEYEIRVPGEKPRTVRRTVFDLLGPAARATSSPRLVLDETKRLTRSLALAMQTEILPVACGLSREFAAHLLAQNLLSNRDLFQFLMQGGLPAGIANVDQLFDRSSPPLSQLYSLAFTRTEWGKRDEVFIDRPNILTRHMYAVPSGKDLVMRDATDIVANGVGVSLAAQDVFAARLEQGVLDTNAESLVRIPSSTLDNVGDAFTVSRRWKAVGSNQGAIALGKLDLAEDVRGQIAADLSGGYAVVAPESAVRMKGEPFAGWWRIDPSTGDSLGMGANGWGTATVEESPQNARTARTAPIWKNAYVRFALRWARMSAENYAWCLAPMVLRAAVYDAPKVGWGLAIWEGAVKPSVGACGPLSIALGGITAWLLPVRALRLAKFGPIGGGAAGLGRSAGGMGGAGRGPTQRPKIPPKPPGGGPNETGGGPPNEPNANPPKDNPCNGGSEGSGADPSKTQLDPDAQPSEPGQGPQGTTAQQLQQQLTAAQDAEFATAAAAEDAMKEFTKSFNEMGQYRQEHNVKFGEGTISGDATFDPNVYEKLVETNNKDFELAQDALAKQTEAQQAADQAEQAWDKFVNQQVNGGGGGACGGGGGKAGGGVPQPVTSLDPALANAQPASDVFGQTQPGANPYGQTQPGANPYGQTQPGANPYGQTQPGANPYGQTQPGAPPTQRSPQTPGAQPGPDESIPPTEPGSPPTRRGSPDPGSPPTQRSPQNSPMPGSPAQKTLTGIGGVLGALGGK